MAADNDVINPDQPGNRANREDDWQRRKSGREKSETDDVGFARAPVAVEQRRRAFPINIARPMHAGRLPKQGFRHFLGGTFDCFARPAQVYSMGSEPDWRLPNRPSQSEPAAGVDDSGILLPTEG